MGTMPHHEDSGKGSCSGQSYHWSHRSYPNVLACQRFCFHRQEVMLIVDQMLVWLDTGTTRSLDQETCAVQSRSNPNADLPPAFAIKG